MSKEDIEKFEKFQKWVKYMSKCKQAWQQYIGAPSPLPTCKLTEDACRYENCPKLKIILESV